MELALAEEPIPEPLIHKVLREATRAPADSAGAVRVGAARHGRAADSRRGGRVLAESDRRAAGRRHRPRTKHKGKGKAAEAATASRRRKSSPQARSGRAVLRPGVQGAAVQDGRPGLGADLLGHARAQLARAEFDARQEGKRRPAVADSRVSKKDEQLESARAGDIVGVIGLRDSITGDTLCDTREPILLASIEFPETVISMAIEAESTDDRKKLAKRWPCCASRTRRFAPKRIPRPARRSSAAWASCTWK